MRDDEIKGACLRAIDKLFARDQDLLDLAANERSITHKLGEYLSDEFPDFDVDCEYNRLGNEGDTKYLTFFLENTEAFANGEEPRVDVKARSVYPDIIVHKRALPENILVIEMKTTSSGGDSEKDQRKLEAFTSPHSMAPGAPTFNYQLGLYIEVTTGLGLTSHSPLIARGIWFVGGHSETTTMNPLVEVSRFEGI